MKKLLLGVLCMLLASTARAGDFRPAVAHGVENQYIVVLHEGTARRQGAAATATALPSVRAVSQELALRHGGRVREVWQSALQGFVVDMPEPAARALARDPRVRFVEQNSQFSAPTIDCRDTVPPQKQDRGYPTGPVQSLSCSDPLGECTDNWGLDRMDQVAVERDNAYSFSRTGAGVHVYVLDSGIQADHSEFRGANGASRIGAGVSFMSGVQSTNVEEGTAHGHGTHVSAIIGGKTYGVAKGVTIHPVKVLASGQLADLISGIDWVKQNRILPAVANLSGANKTGFAGNPALEVAIRGLTEEGDIMLVQAAGNQGEDACDWSAGRPFAAPKVIVVGGTDWEDNRYLDLIYCSVTGDCGSNTGRCVDIWAPAEEIASASLANVDANGDTLRDGYCRLSGTSMAAPHVTGAIALFLEGRNAANGKPEAIETALLANASRDRLTAGEGDPDSIGAGSPNLLVRVPFPQGGPPVAGADRFIYNPAGTTQVQHSTLLENDVEWGRRTLTVSAVADPAHGEVTQGATSFTYDPAGFSAAEAFLYTLGGPDGTATGVISAFPNNPVAVDDHYGAQRTFGAAVYASDLVDNDFKPDGTAVTFVGFLTQPLHGTWTQAQGYWLYKPNAGFNGTDSVRYRIQDGSQRIADGTVFFTPFTAQGGSSPADDYAEAVQDQPLTLDIRRNDPTPTAAVVVVTSPSHGTAVLQADGRVLYTPAAGYAGYDSFTYALRDSQGNVEGGSVRLDISPVLPGPVPADDNLCATADRATGIPYSALLANDAGSGLEVVLGGFSDPPHGTIDICCNPSGFRYTPDAGYTGADSFSYTVEDDGHQQDSAQVFMNVVIGPVAVDDTVNHTGSETVGILYQTLLDNDTGTGLRVLPTGFGPPSHGTIDLCCNPSGFRYVPEPGFVGTDTFTYTITKDGCENLTNGGTVTITLANRDPVATNDSAVTQRNTPVTIAVLNNDHDPDGHALTVQVSDPQVVVNPDRTVTYTPAAGFTGPKIFNYTIDDGHGSTATATVTVTVNAPPIAVPESFPTFQKATLTFTCAQLLANDSDPDSGIVPTVISIGPIAAGTGTLSCSNCTCTFVSANGFANTTSFPYTIRDNQNGTATAIDTINVANVPPVANDDTASTPQNASVLVNVLANDTDAGFDTLTIQSVTTPSSGTAVIEGNAIRYTPGNQGTQFFDYTVNDGHSGTDTARVFVNVGPPNTAPDARGNQLALPYGFTSTIHHATLLSNDYDPDGNALTISGFNTAGLYGTLSCGASSCTYTPPYGFVGVTSYSYTVSDGRGGTDSATVKLKMGVTQNPPVAADDLFTTSRNVAKAFTIFDVLANDTDPDGDVLNAVIIPGPRDYGSVSCTSPTYNCTYAPNAGFVGLDRFAYTADDQTGGTSTAYIRMAVLPPAFPGALDAREDQFTTSQNMQRFIPFGALKANDYDPEGDPLTITGYDKAGLNGTLDCTSDPNGCLYRPGSYFWGTTRFKYTVSDGHGNTDTAIVRIKVGAANGTPVIAGETLTTAKNTPLRFSIFDLLKNDYDPENDPLNLTVYPTTPTRGTLSCGTPQYWCTYTPFTNLTGNDSFIYVITDGIAYTSTATVTVTVMP